MCIGAASGASAAGIGHVGAAGAGANAGAGPRAGRAGPPPPIVACAATAWKRFAASAGSRAVLGAWCAGTPFAGRPVNMASMVGRSAAPNGVERKSLGSAAIHIISTPGVGERGTDTYM